MAKRKTAVKSVVPKEVKPAPVFEAPKNALVDGMRPEHRTFSHVMYILFLITVTIAAFFTFASFKRLATIEEMYGILALVFLMWSFLFWEFGHRIHHVGQQGWK